MSLLNGFIGAGTFINIVAVIIGASLGIVAGSRFSVKSQQLITDVLGLITLLAAASALSELFSPTFKNELRDGSSLLIVLGAMLLGGLIGSALRLESRLDAFGENLRRKFRASAESSFP